MLVSLIYTADGCPTGGVVHNVEYDVTLQSFLFIAFFSIFSSPQSFKTMKSLVKHVFVWVLFFWAGKWVRPCIAFDISIFVCLFVFVDEPQPLTQLNGSLLAPGPLPPLTTPPTPPMDSPLPSVCPIMPTPTPPLIPPSSSSPGCGSGSASSEQPGSGPLVAGAASTSASNSPSNPETEEDKAKKLLYCSLCKVAVNSLSQLEAHNKGGLICELRRAENGCSAVMLEIKQCAISYRGIPIWSSVDDASGEETFSDSLRLLHQVLRIKFQR